MRFSLTAGVASGAPLMKFTLVYDGDLPSSGNKPKPDAKAAIRAQLDPQLRELWEARTDLRRLRVHRVLHTTMIPGPLPHHSITEIPPPFLTPNSIAPDNPNLIDLCPPIERKSPSGSVVNYFPLRP